MSRPQVEPSAGHSGQPEGWLRRLRRVPARGGKSRRGEPVDQPLVRAIALRRDDSANCHRSDSPPLRASQSRDAARRSGESQVLTSDWLKVSTGWAVVNKPPGAYDRCPMTCRPPRRIYGLPAPGTPRPGVAEVDLIRGCSGPTAPTLGRLADASVDPTEARSAGSGPALSPCSLSLAEMNRVIQCSRDALSVQGPLRFCGRIPRIIGLPELSSFHDRPMTLRRTAPPGGSSRSRSAMTVSRTQSKRRGAVLCGCPVGRPSSVSGRVVQVARGGFRRLGPPQHGAQGRLAQRRAQHPVGPEGGHDPGRVVLLPP